MCACSDDSDGLNYLAGKTLFEINRTSIKAAMQADIRGGVPCILIGADCPDEYHFGQMVYFFERACAVSVLISVVNPFDQPGVEAYKNNMFRLLGRAGYAE